MPLKPPLQIRSISKIGLFPTPLSKCRKMQSYGSSIRFLILGREDHFNQIDCRLSRKVLGRKMPMDNRASSFRDLKSASWHLRSFDRLRSRAPMPHVHNGERTREITVVCLFTYPFDLSSLQIFLGFKAIMAAPFCRSSPHSRNMCLFYALIAPARSPESQHIGERDGGLLHSALNSCPLLLSEKPPLRSFHLAYQ